MLKCEIGEYGGFKTGGSPAIGDVDVSLERNKITIKGNKNFNSGELYQAHGIYYILHVFISCFFCNIHNSSPFLH